MKILNLSATDGPNYWSIHRQKLIIVTLDLDSLEQRPSNTIPGFADRLEKLMPSLVEHHCSEGVPGGLFIRVREGTWMGHIIEHIALELQTMAGMTAGFGRTRDAGKEGVYHVVFEYEIEEAGRFAAMAAIRIADALIHASPYNLCADIEALKDLKAKHGFGPSTAALLKEATKKDIPFIRLNNDSFIQLGYGSNQQRIEATIASTTSHMAVEAACNKADTKALLHGNSIPVPFGYTITDIDGLKNVLPSIGFPLVIKPLDGNHGNGATTNICNESDAIKAFHIAKHFSKEVICEKYISGSDFRILVIDYRFVAASLRTPACITGDGVHSIRDLIATVNRDPRRGNGHDNVLTQIVIDEVTIHHLKTQDLTLDSVVPHGRKIMLKPTANLSTGGTATDVTDEIHPGNIAMFERTARIIGLNICGIDVISSNLSEPMAKTGGAIIEVNAGPGFRMHLSPSKGKPRNVAKPVINMLFPNDSNGRIPIMAVTGTNGKTTTTRLLAHITKQAGFRTGYTTTDGIYIQDEMVMKGDCTGAVSTRIVLKDPSVNMAVLECARGGILRNGLGFDKCNVGIVTNVAEDHLGMHGIDSIYKLARVKATIPESVDKHGYAVLNADDNIVYGMKEKLSCNIALFSMNGANPRITAHREQGGITAVLDNGYIICRRGGQSYRLGHVRDMPITFGGTACFNIENILAAAVGAFAYGISTQVISNALQTFSPDPEMIPGRMNVFEFDSFKVIVDYAHNMPSVRAIAPFIRSIPASVKVGVIAGVGDRRDQDITSLAAEAANIFDEIVIRHDKDLRGRKPEELERLIYKGIQQVDPDKKVTVVPQELKAVESVLQNAVRDSVTVFFVDDVKSVINELETAKKFQATLQPA